MKIGTEKQNAYAKALAEQAEVDIQEAIQEALGRSPEGDLDKREASQVIGWLKERIAARRREELEAAVEEVIERTLEPVEGAEEELAAREKETGWPYTVASLLEMQKKARRPKRGRDRAWYVEITEPDGFRIPVRLENLAERLQFQPLVEGYVFDALGRIAKFDSAKGIWIEVQEASWIEGKVKQIVRAAR